MENYLETIISQYGDSPVLQALIGGLNDAIDPAATITQFYKDVWNVLTAQGYGLDVWGRIVGVSRVVHVPGPQKYFGFDEATPDSADPFNQSPFFNGTFATTPYALTDDVFRRLILAKALSNISRASIPAYNTILRLLFPGRGNAFITDPGYMSAQITVEFDLLPYERAMLDQSGALPFPTGVGFHVSEIPNLIYFGFAEGGDGLESFDNGIFYSGNYQG